METHSNIPNPHEAAGTLHAITSDAQRLSDRIRTPWLLMAAFGAIAAWWVGTAIFTTPGEDYEALYGAVLAIPLVMIVVHLLRQHTGVKIRRIGALANVWMAGIFAVAAVLFSVALGFVSFGVGWAVPILSAVAFVATMLLAGGAFRAAMAHATR